MPHFPTPAGRCELVMLEGLPASGKTTLAQRMVLDADPGTMVRVSADDLRAQLHAGRHAGRVTEALVQAARDELIGLYLSRGVNVVCDDTNLAPHHAERLAALAWEHGASFTVLSLADVPVSECVRRDALRGQAMVGAAAIERMARSDLLLPRRRDGHPPMVPAPAHDPSLPSVYLCDIDGTLARMVPGGRDPYDATRVGEDIPSWPVVAQVRALRALGQRVILFSGRDASSREQTQAWLAEHVADDLELHMRASGDNRRDSLIKYDLYNAHIRDRFNVTAVFDDRDQVVTTWRTLGLTCFQVAPGRF